MGNFVAQRNRTIQEDHMADPNFATNLRRLLLFEHKSGKEAAAALGVTEATVSRWLTGKRYPSAEALITIDKRYGVSPRDLDADEFEFAAKLADRDRMMAVTRARVDALEKVVPISKARRK
jgi:transcriptional regulator with XRE-family HTH domain